MLLLIRDAACKDRPLPPLEALKYAKANGFKGIQIAVEAPHLSFEEFSDEDALTQVSQSTHGIMRKLLHDLTLSRRPAGLKVSHRIPLRFS